MPFFLVAIVESFHFMLLWILQTMAGFLCVQTKISMLAHLQCLVSTSAVPGKSLSLTHCLVVSAEVTDSSTSTKKLIFSVFLCVEIFDFHLFRSLQKRKTGHFQHDKLLKPLKILKHWLLLHYIVLIGQFKCSFFNLLWPSQLTAQNDTTTITCDGGNKYYFIFGVIW